MILLIAMMLAVTAFADGESAVLQALYNPDYPSPVVEAHEPAGDDYFADAVLIGDSMMEYVELLGELPTANYVWQIGMSPASIGRKQFRVKGTNARLTTFEKVAEYAPRKIYILLGSNGLDKNSYKYIIADYEKLADAMITHFPDALIYVISPPPMSYSRMTGDHYVPVSRYMNFAHELMALAERRHFYYIELYSLLADDQGYLPRQYDSGDGYHLSNRAYALLIDTIRRQTVPYPDGKE